MQRKKKSKSEMNENNLIVQKRHYDKAYEYIDKAIDLDGRISKHGDTLGDINEVRRLYKLGLAEIRTCLSLRFAEDEWQRAQILENKMKQHVQMVEERLFELSKFQPKQQTQLVNNLKLPPNLDPKLGNWILNELLVSKPDVTWKDVAGLDHAKRLLQELVILPTLRPDLYTGLRSPAKGVLLFGPPGTGKTLLAKALAHECNAHFFALSASSLVSKYLGESEKLVRTLFELARYIGNCVLFFDEIDSILGKRKDDEHEASRRLKTEFLVQFDGVKSDSGSDKILVIGATNRPHELDEAARRRFTQRIFIPLPEPETRRQILKNLLTKQSNSVGHGDLSTLVELTDGYSCSDITALAKEAALYPLRDLTPEQLKTVKASHIRKMNLEDFRKAMLRIRASVSKEEVEITSKWAKEFGSSA